MSPIARNICKDYTNVLNVRQHPTPLGPPIAGEVLLYWDCRSQPSHLCSWLFPCKGDYRGRPHGSPHSGSGIMGKEARRAVSGLRGALRRAVWRTKVDDGGTLLPRSAKSDS